MASVGSFEMEAGLRLLHVLAILTRSTHNRQIFSFFGGLQKLMGLMKAAVVQLKAVAGILTTEDNPPSSVQMLSSYLQCLLAHIVSVVSNFIDGEVRESGDKTVGRADILFQHSVGSNDNQLPGSRRASFFGSEKQGTSRNTLPLMETGGLNWFVELLRILRKLRLKGLLAEASLEQLILKTLKVALMGNLRAQNHFRSIGGVEVLMDGLGSPLKNVSRGAQSNPQEWILKYLLADFQMQFLSLEVLREAIFRNLSNLQFLYEIGGVYKFVEVVSWAAFVFPEVNLEGHGSCPSQFPGSKGLLMNSDMIENAISGSKESAESSICGTTKSSEDNQGIVRDRGLHQEMVDFLAFPHGEHDSSLDCDNLQGWNFQVAQICKILCSFLVPAGDIRNFASGLIGGQDALGVSSPYWELASRWIIKVLLGVFKGKEGFSTRKDELKSLRLSSTTLQHYVLYVFKKMLAVSPTVLNLFREEGVWEVMFSEFFFYFEMTNEALLMQKDPEGDKASYNIFESCHHDKEIIDSEPLRLEVISFLEFAATVSGSYDNVPECTILFEALEQCSHIPSVATMVAKSLHRVLQLAVEPTIFSFQKLDALTRLSQVMDVQLQAFTSAIDKELHVKGGQTDFEVGSMENIKASWHLLTCKEAWKQSREAVFDLFAEFLLASEEARIVSLHSTKTLEVLFELLWESEYRRFALRHIVDLMKLPPMSEEDQEAKLELCIKYLEAISRSRVEGLHEELDILVDLLNGVHEILQTDLTYYQALFREAECFVHIVTLLNENNSNDAAHLLSLNVVQTLTRLLAGNEASKVAFRSLVGVGYPTLQNLLLNCHQGCPTKSLLTALLDMLVDGIFDLPTNMVIQNEDVIALFLNILQQCNEVLQLFGLDTFHLLLEESTSNRASCVRAGLLSLLLEWFGSEQKDNLIAKIAQLIQSIGGHSISGKDMRRIFALLRRTKDGCMAKHGTLLLSVIRGMLREEGPAVFFELSGKDSGIVITTPMRWPSNRGFSFSCWARVESFPAVGHPDANGGFMGLFTFLTESGKGCTALINEGKLIVESASHRQQVVTLNIELQAKRWYFLCITHTTGRPLSGGSILRVYLDGSLAASDKLRYPKVNEPLTRCTLGASSPLPASEGIISDVLSSRFSSPFCGQFGPIYLFDDALSSDQVLGIFSASPGYMYSFLSTEVGCIPENLSTNNILDSKDGLAPKLIFGFNAQASSGRTLFDVSPLVEQMADKTLYEATIMAGTQLCYRRLVKDIIDCVGGVCVFFPLLTQVDQPPILSGPCKERRLTEEMHYDSHYDASEVIELIGAVLNGNYANQLYMHQIKGLSILGLLLQSVSPQHLTIDVVAALGHLLTTVANASDRSLSEQLVKETLLKIHLNPHIWIFTPYVVQREVYMQLLNYFENDASLLQSICSLAMILDIIRQFYWDKPRTRSALGTKPFLHPVTREIIGERPSQDEVAKLRLLLLSLAEVFLRDTISMSDTKALLAYIEKIEDTVCLEDVLHVFLGLLGRRCFLTAFMEHMQSLGGCHVFLSLLKRQKEALRLLGLRILGRILISMPSEKKGLRIFSIATGSTRFSYEQQRLEKIKLAPLFSAITERLLAFPFTDALCATLFDVLLGGASLKQVLQRGTSPEKDTGLSAQGSSTLGSTSHFVLPQVLGIILKFMLICEDLAMQQGVLIDLLRLLEDNPSSSDALILEPSWQDWFFSLMVDIQNRKQKIEGEDDKIKMLAEEELTIRRIFAIIHCECICNMRGGWRHVERTVNFVHVFAERGLLPKFYLLHDLLGDLVETILQARSQQFAQMTQPCRDNVLYLLTLVDELVIKDTTQYLPFLSDDVLESTINDNSSGESDINLGSYTIVQPESSRQSNDELTGSQGSRRSSATSQNRGWQRQVLQGQDVEIKDQCWRMYDKVWDLLRDTFGRGRASLMMSGSGPSLGQRARGLVESINIPAAEMAAAVVSGGLGAVVSMNPSKLIDKAVKLRGEKCPRVVFRLVLLYLYRANLGAASQCVQQFLALLPFFLMGENEQSKNRLQLFLWSLLDARAQIGSMDDGARFHIISQLIREAVEHGKSLLATTILEKDEGGSYESVSVHSLLQQDRVTAAVREEKRYLKTLLADRGNEAQSLQMDLNEASIVEFQQAKLLEEQVQTSLAAVCLGDTSRRAGLQLMYDEDQQAVTEIWCHMLRDLTDERGPWSTVSFPNDTLIRWKLDKTEDPWRRRFKLKRNYHFKEQLLYPPKSPQSIASETLDTSIGNDQSITYNIMGEVKSFLLKGLRGVSEEETLDSVEEEKETSEENEVMAFSEQRQILPQDAPINAEDETISASQQEVVPELLDTGGEVEVLLSTACVLITPKRKLAGRLEIIQGSLHFYCEFLVEGTGGSSVFSSSGGLNYLYYQSSDHAEKGNQKNLEVLREFQVENIAGDYDKGNAMERLVPVQSFTTQGAASIDIKRHRRWELLKVKAVHGTRYLLQYSALELFFTNSIPPVFFNFPSQKQAKDVGMKIVSLRNKLSSGKASTKDREDNIYFVDKRLSIELAERARDQWRRREINNFEYLMTLNTLAGRSYNDLTQYPVFPWVLSDYSSDILDLTTPSSFRDLSKPVGGLDTKRFEVFEERFHNFSDPDIPSFYYGSHYSSMGIVLFYLLRLEPFTTLHQNLQGGKFDHADRLFHSIEGSFANCLTNTSDVKELIPEFFYMPDFLINSNNYYFGIKQDGEQLGNVVLPRWAKASPEDFILKNREALESEYVSQHLHLWIDLIFGYKQRGRPAVEAANVFYHLTYEGAVDLESMEDRLQRAAIEDQIANFGQTPIQLFRKKHPRRGAPIPVSRPLYYAPASITLTSSVSASTLSHGSTVEKQTPALLYVGVVDGKVVLVNGRLTVVIRSWLTPLQAGGTFTFSYSQDPFFGIGSDVTPPFRIGGPMAENLDANARCFGTLQVRSSSYLLTSGHWDNSFRVISLNDGHLLQSNRQHKDVVSCLSVSNNGRIVVTGSHDTTVMVWEVEPVAHVNKRVGQKDAQDRSLKGETILFQKPHHILCGHDDAITCVAVSVELDLVISGSKDTTCIFHTLREGRYVRSLQHPFRSSISKLVISHQGLMAIFSNDDLAFLLYSVNGKHLATAESNGRLNCMETSSCGEFLVCGGDNGQVVVRSMYTLDVLRRYEGIGSPVLSLTVTAEDCFLVGTQEGSLLIYSIEIQQQKKPNILQTLRTRQLPQGVS